MCIRDRFWVRSDIASAVLNVARGPVACNWGTFRLLIKIASKRLWLIFEESSPVWFMVSRALLTFRLALVRLESEGKNVGLVLFRGTCTFFPVRRQKFKSPIKCLSNYVDKHIKIGFAQIYQKKTPASPVACLHIDFGLSPKGDRPNRCNRCPWRA